MKRACWILIGMALLILGALATWLAVPGPGDAPPPTYITLARMSNVVTATGALQTGFVVSNVSRFPVICMVAGPQVLMTNAVMGRQGRLTNLVWDWNRSLVPRAVVMKPGESLSFPEQPPTIAVPWRFGVLVVRRATPWRLALDQLASALPSPLSSVLHADRRHAELRRSEVIYPPSNQVPGGSVP